MTRRRRLKSASCWRCGAIYTQGEYFRHVQTSQHQRALKEPK